MHQFANIRDFWINLGDFIDDLVLHGGFFDVFGEDIVQRTDCTAFQIRTDLVIVGHLLNRSDSLSVGCMGARTGSLVPDFGIPVF